MHHKDQRFLTYETANGRKILEHYETDQELKAAIAKLPGTATIEVGAYWGKACWHAKGILKLLKDQEQRKDAKR